MIVLPCSPSGLVLTVYVSLMKPIGLDGIWLRKFATRTNCCSSTVYTVCTHQQARFVVKHFYAERTDSPAELRSQTNNNNYATALELEFDITYNFVKDKRRFTWFNRLISTLKIMSNGVNLESNGGSVNSDGDNSIGEDGMRRKNSLERYRPGAYFNLVNSWVVKSLHVNFKWKKKDK